MAKTLLPPFEMAFVKRLGNGGTDYSKWESTSHRLLMSPSGSAIVPVGFPPILDQRTWRVLLFVYAERLTLPASAKRLYAVATHGPRPKEGFRLLKDGGLAAFSRYPCGAWKRFLLAYYESGYRWVQFQYEE